jgi:hypothetical protein
MSSKSRRGDSWVHFGYECAFLVAEGSHDGDLSCSLALAQGGCGVSTLQVVGNRVGGSPGQEI